MSTIDDIRANEIRRVEAIREPWKATNYNHLFRSSLGIPPSRYDKLLGGADPPDGWDFAGANQQPCPECGQARARELFLAEQLGGVSS